MQSCIVCGEAKEEGISIWNQFICSECEQEMIHTEVEDKRYSYFINKLKTIWLKKDA
jgi:predicted nucleic acid-binding Zn ribbon protein